MASVIKVDTIQLSDGSTPTAGDLGITPLPPLPVSLTHQNQSLALSTTGAWVDVPLSTVSFTPNNADSKLLIESYQHSYCNHATWETTAIRILVDDVVISATNEHGSYYGYANYGDRGMGYAHDAAMYTCTSTSPVTIKIQAMTLQAGAVLNQYGFGRTLVTEIAQ